MSDTIGVEQGGVNSDQIYKLCNNVQLSTAQDSGLGVDMGSVVVSSIGQADDTALVSNSLPKLAGLLQLAIEYCKSYHAELVAEKTKLLVYSPSAQSIFIISSSFLTLYFSMATKLSPLQVLSMWEF